MRTIQVQAGIGDNIWLLMKLINSGEKFNFELPDGKPQRGAQIFELLPQVTNTVKYVSGLNSKKLERMNVQRYRNQFRKIRQDKFALSANRHLEYGRRIEQFFPDLETSFVIPWVTTETQKKSADNYHCGPEHKLVGIYCSSYSTSRAWGFWDENKWLEFIQLINEGRNDLVFVIIGAEWDIDIAKNLSVLLEENKIPFLYSVGEDLGTVIEIMKKLYIFCGFPSGLSVVNETLPGRATLMFYPEHLERMQNAWAYPKRIEEGDYVPLLFCDPEEAYANIRHLMELPEILEPEDTFTTTGAKRIKSAVAYAAEQLSKDLGAEEVSVTLTDPDGSTEQVTRKKLATDPDEIAKEFEAPVLKPRHELPEDKRKQNKGRPPKNK